MCAFSDSGNCSFSNKACCVLYAMHLKMLLCLPELLNYLQKRFFNLGHFLCVMVATMVDSLFSCSCSINCIICIMMCRSCLSFLSIDGLCSLALFVM